MGLEILRVDLQDPFERRDGVLVLALQEQDASELVQDDAIAGYLSEAVRRCPAASS